MTSIFRLLRRISPSKPHSVTLPADAIDRALDRDISTVSSRNPETIEQWNLLRAQIEQRTRDVPSPAAKRQALWLRPAAAAGLVGAALAVVAGFLWFRPAAPLMYETGIQAQSVVLLADSSEVTLNHNSALAVLGQDAVDGRSTTLAGEAFFRVRKTGTPFIVTTDLGSVQVLGTEFNVRVRRGKMEVAVVSGRVRVTASWEGKDSTVLLEGGEFTAFARGAYPDSPQRLPYVENFPGWLHGKFVFDRATLETACLEISEQFGIPIAIGNPALPGRTITGVVDGRSLEAAVKTLCLLSGTSYRNENSGYTLY